MRLERKKSQYTHYKKLDYTTDIKYPDIHNVIYKHHFKGILKCSLYKELFLRLFI